MKFLVLGLNYAPEEIGIAVYTTGLCQELVQRGHEVRVVAAQPYYPQWRIADGFRNRWNRSHEAGVDVLRCPVYVPPIPIGTKRLLHHASFALSSFFPTVSAAWRFRPDLVLTIAPSLAAAPIAWLAAKMAGARSWLHVQDFEVEAAFATGLLDSTSRIARLARRCERAAIRLFDKVSSISPEMCAKLRAFGIGDDRIMEVRNWANTDDIRPRDTVSPYRAEWNISTPHVALYSGSIANKQGIDIVVDAARNLSHRSDLTFVVCGEGPNRANLERGARGLDNIRFHDLQPTARLGDVLCLATVHLLPQRAGAADLVLPSKLTNMLASGRPTIATAASDTGIAREVEGCGLITPPGDAAAFADAVQKLIDDPPLHRAMSVAARTRAEYVWCRTQIIEEFERSAESLVGGGAHDQ